MKKKILIILLLLCCFISPTIGKTFAYSSVSKSYFNIDYEADIYNNTNNIYSSRDNLESKYFKLNIYRNTGSAFYFKTSSTVNYSGTFNYVQTIDLTTGFSVIFKDSGNNYVIARSPYIEITTNYNLTYNSGATAYLLNINSFSYKLKCINAIGASPLDITNNHLIKVLPSLNDNYYSSLLPLEIYPKDIIGTNGVFSLYQINLPYNIRLNYVNEKNSLYYARNTAVIVGIKSPYKDNNPSWNSYVHTNYYSASLFNGFTEGSTFDGFISGQVPRLTTNFYLFQNVLINNYNYQSYYPYIGQFYINTGTNAYTNISNTQSYYYQTWYILDNPLYATNGEFDYTSSLVSPSLNNYYKEASSWFDILTHLYNFLIYLVFDMPLVSDIIQFFGYIVDFIVEIFGLLTSFGGIPLISIILGLFFLIFFLRFLL